jgi:prepilin-type N-terminal cleavage/methylation domain-containing protein
MKPLRLHSNGLDARRRNGITLLEVLIALAIFLGSFAIISQIMRTGAQASNQGQQQNEIVLRARSLMNEVLAGSVELEPVQEASFDDTDLYTWSMSISDGPIPDLFIVEVTVARRRQGGTGDMPFTLTRYMRDPEVFLQSTTVEPSLF